MGVSGTTETSMRQVSPEELERWKEQFKEEVNAMKERLEKNEGEHDELFHYWVNFYKENPGTLPSKVQSVTGKVVHINLTKSAASPPLSWRTACGWSYYGSNFIFQNSEAVVNCQKCNGLCAKMQ